MLLEYAQKRTGLPGELGVEFVPETITGTGSGWSCSLIPGECDLIPAPDAVASVLPSSAQTGEACPGFRHQRVSGSCGSSVPPGFVKALAGGKLVVWEVQATLLHKEEGIQGLNC